MLFVVVCCYLGVGDVLFMFLTFGVKFIRCVLELDCLLIWYVVECSWK